MTPAELRKICDSLNDERGTGGQTELARRLGWNASTVRRKLADKSKITKSDELAIKAVLSVQLDKLSPFDRDRFFINRLV